LAEFATTTRDDQLHPSAVGSEAVARECPVRVISDGVGGIGAWPLFIRLPKSRPSRRGEPPDENNASAASESHCAALCLNILTIIPIATDHEVAARHFGKTNSFMKSYQNQMLHRSAEVPVGGSRRSRFTSAEHFVKTN
jgi:hypothetical protein